MPTVAICNNCKEQIRYNRKGWWIHFRASDLHCVGTKIQAKPAKGTRERIPA